MNRHKLVKQEIRSLEHRLDKLQTTLAPLQTENARLVLCHHLLTAWCEAVGQLRQFIACLLYNDPDDQDLLLSAEHTLLRELAHSQTVADSLTPLCLGHARALAPDSDPMAYFRHHVTMTPLPEALTMTPRDLAQLLAGITLEVSVHLHVLNSQPQEAQKAALQRLEELWDR